MGMWAPSDWSDGQEEEEIKRLAARLEIAAQERGTWSRDHDFFADARELVSRYGRF